MKKLLKVIKKYIGLFGFLNVFYFSVLSSYFV